jgi:hypothetical protein
MRRLTAIAAFAIFLALPLWAQHGGHAAGGHGGGFGGHAGFSGGRGSGGMHSGTSSGRGFSQAPAFAQRGFSQRGFANRGFSNRGFSSRGFSNRPFLHDGFRGSRFRDHRRFRNNCFGFGCLGYGYYDPYWWWDSGSSYDEDYERDRQIANEMNQQSLEEQRMRQEEADGDQDGYARSSPRASSHPTASDDPQGAETVPATVLVFRDQRRVEIRNYAIVGQTIWNFASPRTQKIPLSDLDLATTMKANEDRGLTFRVPASNEAQ